MTRLFKIGFGIACAFPITGIVIAELTHGDFHDAIITFCAIFGACIFIGTVALDFKKDTQ